MTNTTETPEERYERESGLIDAAKNAIGIHNYCGAIEACHNNFHLDRLRELVEAERERDELREICARVLCESLQSNDGSLHPSQDSLSVLQELLK